MQDRCRTSPVNVFIAVETQADTVGYEPMNPLCRWISRCIKGSKH
jgi:hypothetical protein